MVVTQELRNVSAMGLRDITYDVGPFITLVDGPLFEFLWEERRSLLLGQVNDADLVAVSRTDLLDPQRLEQIQNTLQEYSIRIFGLSVHQGSGMEEVIQKLENLA